MIARKRFSFSQAPISTPILFRLLSSSPSYVTPRTNLFFREPVEVIPHKALQSSSVVGAAQLEPLRDAVWPVMGRTLHSGTPLQQRQDRCFERNTAQRACSCDSFFSAAALQANRCGTPHHVVWTRSGKEHETPPLP